MSDHPTTYGGEAAEGGIAWDDRAEIHVKDDGQGLFDGAKGLHEGSFSNMVKMMMAMPEDDRRNHVIQKLGDRMYTPSEVEALSKRPDFPG
ncbi:hypothetical protein [Alteriqipengyuania lutimaris]|uniref:Uncharacterized protein n=1 Tax=Alteriqipengyuania lutimaris TaxID=1538146 RepID=A0A395LRN4_9SPHN|nr:hypothetical protein [Alteriqipengyuania lutimaris]MBB3032729.1 hypothetical protein [Alteriqipengyuania lutimaris]RDS78164.1 hypothetical protein DL238_11495 [Alteriqipengyuania lutimaris]